MTLASLTPDEFRVLSLALREFYLGFACVGESTKDSEIAADLLVQLQTVAPENEAVLIQKTLKGKR